MADMDGSSQEFPATVYNTRSSSNQPDGLSQDHGLCDVCRITSSMRYKEGDKWVCSKACADSVRLPSSASASAELKPVATPEYIAVTVADDYYIHII